MSRIRKVDSYRSPHLAINQLSYLNNYGSSAADSVNEVDRVFPLYNNMPQLNKYEDDMPDKNSSTNPKQTVSDLSNQGTVISNHGFDTVTLHIEQYEQMRKNQENLEKLKEMMKEMIQFRQNTGDGSFDIRVDKGTVKKYVSQQLRKHDKDTWGIDQSDIKLK